MTRIARLAAALVAVAAIVSAPIPIAAAPQTMQPVLAPQGAPGQDARPALLATVPVRVDVVLTRLQGEKKVSNLPFSLLANATDPRDRQNPVAIRMGVDVPIGTSTTTTTNSEPSTAANAATRSTGTTRTNLQYRNVGTDIDCQVTRLDENRYSVRVSVSDSSVYSPDGLSGAKTALIGEASPAAFRTFSTGNTVVMRDGQTVLFGVGTDKISGETLKVEVTLDVVK